MSNLENQLEEIDCFLKYQETIVQFYERYFKMFPDWEELWNILLLEAKNNLFLLQKGRDKLASSSSSLPQERLSLHQLKTAVNFARGLLAKTQQRHFSIKKALLYLWSIEEYLVVQKFFEVGEAGADEMKQIFNELATSTKGQLAKIHDALQKV